jgi:sodium-dependent dicarboxylate transporter 2/3/5
MNQDSTFSARQKIGFPLGLLLFLLILALPSTPDLSIEGQRAAAVAVLMATWWISECLPIAVTALVPLAAYPLLNILDMDVTAAQYGNPTVFLMIGGFMIAIAMEKCNLHRRLALLMVSRTGTRPPYLLAGFMLSSAVLSMWISNTATVVMLLPIAVAVLSQIANSADGFSARMSLAQALMLGVAYGASIGGVATLIGSPPNLIFVGQAKALLPELAEIGFMQWTMFALPVSVVFLVLCWAYLSQSCGAWKLPYDADSGKVFQTQLTELGPWTKGEKVVLSVFIATALAWLFRSDVNFGSVIIPGWTALLGLPWVHDGTIAIFAALILFAFPLDLKRGVFALDWPSAVKLPWAVVILMGGGFALAASFQSTGLAQWLAGQFSILEFLPLPVLLLALCLLVTFLTEVTSNTATAVVLMPILAASATILDIHPFLLMIPATLSASFAFMLPVATPPNAIVFASGHVTVRDMSRAGFVLNLLGALLVAVMMLFWGRWVFGI